MAVLSGGQEWPNQSHDGASESATAGLSEHWWGYAHISHHSLGDSAESSLCLWNGSAIYPSGWQAFGNEESPPKEKKRQANFHTVGCESCLNLLLRRPDLKTLTDLRISHSLINIIISWALLHQMSVDSVKNTRKLQSTFSVIVKLLRIKVVAILWQSHLSAGVYA